MKQKTNEKGITLIALVITIIVMLILVAVTVTIAMDGGLFTKSKDAGDKTTIEAEKETLTNVALGEYDGVKGGIDLDNVKESLKTGNTKNKWTNVKKDIDNNIITLQGTQSGEWYVIYGSGTVEKIENTTENDGVITAKITLDSQTTTITLSEEATTSSNSLTLQQRQYSGYDGVIIEIVDAELSDDQVKSIIKASIEDDYEEEYDNYYAAIGELYDREFSEEFIFTSKEDCISNLELSQDATDLEILNACFKAEYTTIQEAGLENLFWLGGSKVLVKLPDNNSPDEYDFCDEKYELIPPKTGIYFYNNILAYFGDKKTGEYTITLKNNTFNVNLTGKITITNLQSGEVIEKEK